MDKNIKVGDPVILANTMGTGYIRGGVVESLDDKFVKISYICEKGSGKGLLVIPRDAIEKDKNGFIKINLM
jgi:hypothetical protein